MRHAWVFLVFLIGCGGQLMFLRDYGADAVPQWMRVGTHILPWLLVMLGDDRAGGARTERLRLAGCVIYLFFDAAAAWLMATGRPPAELRIALPLMIPATVSSVIMIREIFSKPARMQLSDRLRRLIRREMTRGSGDGSAAARAMLLSMLGSPGSDGKRNASLLAEAMVDDAAIVRCAAAEALGRLGRDAAAAATVLDAALSDSDDNVREAAAEALERINGQPAGSS